MPEMTRLGEVEQLGVRLCLFAYLKILRQAERVKFERRGNEGLDRRFLRNRVSRNDMFVGPR